MSPELAPTDDAQLFNAAKRLFERSVTPEERKKLWKAARKIHREQRAGSVITMRTFCLRLLTEGLLLPRDQAAGITDQVLNTNDVPPELRQEMN